MMGLLHAVRRRWLTAVIAAVITAGLGAALLAAAGSLGPRFVSVSTLVMVPRIVQSEMYALQTDGAAGRIVNVLSSPRDSSALIETGAALDPPIPAEDLDPYVSVTAVSGSTTVIVDVDTPSAGLTEQITAAYVDVLTRRAEAATTSLADGLPDVTVQATPGPTREVPGSLTLTISTLALLALVAGALAAVLRDRLDPVIRDAEAVRERWGDDPGFDVARADDREGLFEALVEVRDALPDGAARAGNEPALITLASGPVEGVLTALGEVLDAGSGGYALVARDAGGEALSARALVEGAVAGSASGAERAVGVALDLPAGGALDRARLGRLLSALGSRVDVVVLAVDGAALATRRLAESSADARVVVVEAGRTRWAELARLAQDGHPRTLAVVTPG